jgi:hypothetical protein
MFLFLGLSWPWREIEGGVLAWIDWGERRVLLQLDWMEIGRMTLVKSRAGLVAYEMPRMGCRIVKIFGLRVGVEGVRA